MLNQTNIQNNNNKFYLIQLLENKLGGDYCVWLRWGRVGMKVKFKKNFLENFFGLGSKRLEQI